MEPQPDELEALWRRTSVSPEGECPSSEVIARGASGELSHEERSAFAGHLTACENCAGLVRLYPEVKGWADRASARLGAASRWTTPRTAWLAAAAAVVLGVGLVVVTRFRPAEPPSFRAGAAELSSALELNRPLPRAAFRLKWTPGPAGSRYSVLVARENLAPITRADGLMVPELLVEERLLADLPSGSNVIWRVRAISTDSSALSSPTFVTTVE